MPAASAPVAPGRPWRADLLASLVVFMVALPLCIGIAQACGLPAMAGIVTGIVGGLLVGFAAGSPLQVSGPAAGLIVLVIDFLDGAAAAGHTGPAAVALLGVAIALAGTIQVLAGALRLGPWFRAVSPAVVGGMLAGIGVTIIAKQFHVLVDDQPPKGVVEGLVTIPAAVWKGISQPDGATVNHTQAAVLGLLTLVVLAGWKAVAPKRLKVIPAAVVGVVLVVVVAEAAGFAVQAVKVEGSVFDAFRPIAWPGWGVFGTEFLWKAAVTFALIASAETMLCAVAVDGMRPTGPRTNYDRELIAQGVGNAVCGVVGALPMTGVIVRSSANVEAGARTRLSTILHGAWLLLFVAALPGVLARVPLSALAAVLVYTGWKLVGLPEVARLWRISKSEAVIYVVTAGTIVATDLLTGVITGVVLAALKLLIIFSRLRVTRADDPARNRVDLVLEGTATFLRLPQLAEHLEAVPHGKDLHVHLDEVQLVDHAVMELLVTFQKQYEAAGGTLYLDWERLYAHFGASPPEARGPNRPSAPTPRPDGPGEPEGPSPVSPNGVARVRAS